MPQRASLLAICFSLSTGIGKLRSSGAEGSAFAFWARKYRVQQQAAMDIGKLSEHVVAFSAAVPALASAALFAFALSKGTDSLAVGDFLAVYVMSMTFYVAIARLGQSFEAIAAIAPRGGANSTSAQSCARGDPYGGRGGGIERRNPVRPREFPL